MASGLLAGGLKRLDRRRAEAAWHGPQGMARRPPAATFRIARARLAEVPSRQAALRVEALLQPRGEQAVLVVEEVLGAKMSGWVQHPVQARFAAAAHMRRLTRKRRSEPEERRRVY